MDSTTQDIFHQKIKEFLFDEEKIVTCSSLIADLTISINVAKSLLKSFLRDHHQLNSGELGVTYLLAGLLKDENRLCVSLCQEKELDDKRSLFSKVSSEYIYSIQKNKNIDYNCIGIINKSKSASFEDAGFILSKNFVKRTLKQRQIIVEEKPAPAPSTSKQKQNNFFTQTASSSQKAPVLQSNNKEPAPKKPISKAKSGGITNFFNKAPLAPIEKVNKENKNFEETKETKAESPKNNSKIKKDSTPKEPEVMQIDDDGDDIVVKEKSTKPTKSNTPNKKKRKKSGKNDAPAKKRKRIQQVCDSDSSDMFDDPEDDIIEKSDEERPEKVEIKPSLSLDVKGKRRKAVDKTFMDEEGFLVTSTEYVYETASEDEVEVVPKPEPKAAPKSNGSLKKHSTTDSETDFKETSKKSKNGKKKGVSAANQPTLMNFFKKK